jgi:hypothetical protein
MFWEYIKGIRAAKIKNYYDQCYVNLLYSAKCV